MVENSSLFGAKFDEACRRAGGWPSDAIAYAVEVIGKGDDPMVLVTGEIPVGTKRNGNPQFGKGQVRHKAGIKLSEYRELLPPEGEVK